MTWGYDANIAQLFRQSSQESIFGHAKTLLSDLARLRNGVTRPLVFVCHSLGGLVVKEALIKSATYHSHGRHPKLGEVYMRTSGVVFMGTPHRGSSKTSIGGIVAGIAKVSLRRPNTQLLKTLARDSGILEKQRDDFTTISKDLEVVCIREEVPTGVGLIVPEASASYDGFRVRRDAINANHMDMTKFASQDEEGYKRTLSHIIDLCNVRQVGLQAGTPSHRLSFTGQDEGSPLQIDSNAVVTGKGSTQYSIVSAPSNFLDWIKGEETTGIWISGNAGSGKSTLMKSLYRDKETKAALATWAAKRELILVSYFFTDRGSDLQKSREGLIRSLLHQVLKSRRSLIPQVFKKLFDQPAVDISKFIQFWSNLTAAFESMLKHIQGYKIFMFVDELDEYRMIDRLDEYTERDLELEFDGPTEDATWGQSAWIQDGYREIAKFLLRLRSSHQDLKICTSSRELVVFEQLLNQFNSVRVHEHTALAISKYCQGRLADEAPDLSNHWVFAEVITKKSREVFLWVRLVTDLLIRGNTDGNSKDELWKVLDGLPAKLGGKKGLYMRMLEMIDQAYLLESRQLFELILRWSLGQERSPDLDIFTLFLAQEGHIKQGGKRDLLAADDEFLNQTWEDLRPRWMSYQNRLKSRCAGLVEGVFNVRFMHQTAKEFISRPAVWNNFFRGSVGFTSVLDMDLALLSGVIRRLKCCHIVELFRLSIRILIP
ncbi:hypothetical protein MFIFM68171_06760 [Madurella fahalii]|uniref:Nephrocystin 3-like N-terminal domain-containing protein n=1 Tax=Madurella fahalii TaxID=1157608 RepID=A0ABQ0GFK6_9PEZI